MYYARESLVRRAAAVARKNLVSLGACLGKFTKSGKFHLHVTALDFLAPYAPQKIWLRPAAEQQFLYGHNVLKSGVARTSEALSQFAGVVVLNQNDVPLVYSS